MLNEYVKRFEVSKRLYTEYDECWKAAQNASYEIIDIYIMLAECCILAYKLSGCTKYLSCLLKIDDTLLSVQDKMTAREKREFSNILRNELEEYKKMVKKLEVEA